MPIFKFENVMSTAKLCRVHFPRPVLLQKKGERTVRGWRCMWTAHGPGPLHQDYTCQLCGGSSSHHLQQAPLALLPVQQEG
jgi:hypothetical protein